MSYATEITPSVVAKPFPSTQIMKFKDCITYCFWGERGGFRSPNLQLQAQNNSKTQNHAFKELKKNCSCYKKTIQSSYSE
jgi:hypothetical protein